MPQVFEYSDRWNSPVEAFYCSPERMQLPVGAHWHYFVEMLYVMEGSVLVVCNGISYRLTPGDLLLIPPQAVHSISRDGDHHFLYTCVKYSLTHIRMMEGYLPNLHILFQNLMQEEHPPLLFSAEDLGSMSSAASAGSGHPSPRDTGSMGPASSEASPSHSPAGQLMEEIIREVQQRPYGYLTMIFSRHDTLPIY